MAIGNGRRGRRTAAVGGEDGAARLRADCVSQRVQRVYDERAATYDRSLGVVEHFVLGPLRRTFGSLLQGDTLELAIGTGRNLPFYSAAVNRAAGVDLSFQMLSQAKVRADSIGLPFSFVQADAASLPFAAASFDTVGISLALCTVPEPGAALSEMARVCRPGGRIVMLEHVRSSVGLLAVVERILSPLQERSVACHLDRETFVLAKSLGFTCEVIQARLLDSLRLVVAQPPQASRVTLATSG